MPQCWAKYQRVPVLSVHQEDFVPQRQALRLWAGSVGIFGCESDRERGIGKRGDIYGRHRFEMWPEIDQTLHLVVVQCCVALCSELQLGCHAHTNTVTEFQWQSKHGNRLTMRVTNGHLWLRVGLRLAAQLTVARVQVPLMHSSWI